MFYYKLHIFILAGWPQGAYWAWFTALVVYAVSPEGTEVCFSHEPCVLSQAWLLQLQTFFKQSEVNISQAAGRSNENSVQTHNNTRRNNIPSSLGIHCVVHDLLCGFQWAAYDQFYQDSAFLHTKLQGTCWRGLSSLRRTRSHKNRVTTSVLLLA